MSVNENGTVGAKVSEFTLIHIKKQKFCLNDVLINDFLSFLMIFLPVAWIDQSMPVGEWHGLENPMIIFQSKILRT